MGGACSASATEGSIALSLTCSRLTGSILDEQLTRSDMWRGSRSRLRALVTATHRQWRTAFDLVSIRNVFPCPIWPAGSEFYCHTAFYSDFFSLLCFIFVVSFIFYFFCTQRADEMCRKGRRERSKHFVYFRKRKPVQHDIWRFITI